MSTAEHGDAAGVAAPTPQQRRRRGRRVLAYAATVALLVVLNFVLPRALPGDPITAMLAQGGAQATLPDDAARAALESYYGLDRSLWSQFTDYVGGLATGDLGQSVVGQRRPVATLLAERLPWTLLLMGTAMTIAVGAGLALGIRSGWQSRRRSGWGLLATLTVVRQVPPYFLASLVLLLFAATLGWAPLGGASTPFAATSLGPFERVLDVAVHLLLPAGVLAVQMVATTYLFMRSAMVQELGSGYLLLGRTKGLPEHHLKYRYAARNALLPVVSLTALQLAFATTGSIFVETVFSYPGVGRLMFEAVADRDYPVLQGSFLVLSVAVVTANYAADALYARLDPRVAQ